MTLPVVTSNWRDMAMSNVMNDTREAKCMETWVTSRVKGRCEILQNMAAWK